MVPYGLAQQRPRAHTHAGWGSKPPPANPVKDALAAWEQEEGAASLYLPPPPQMQSNGPDQPIATQDSSLIFIVNGDRCDLVIAKENYSLLHESQWQLSKLLYKSIVVIKNTTLIFDLHVSFGTQIFASFSLYCRVYRGLEPVWIVKKPKNIYLLIRGFLKLLKVS